MAAKFNILKVQALIFSLFFSFAFSPLITSAQEENNLENPEETIHPKQAEEKVDIAKLAFEHILDSHSWHFWGEGHESFSLPLPVILNGENGLAVFSSSEFHHDTQGTHVVEKNGERFVNFEEKIYYASETPNGNGQFLDITNDSKGEPVVSNASPLDFSITKNVASMFVSVAIILLLFLSMAAAYKKTGITSAPKGKQSFFEPVLLFVRDDIAKNNIGDKYERFVPYLLTLFFFILINNVLGMLPFGANLTGNIAFTLVLSVITLIITNVNGNKHYWHHILMPPAPKWLYPILIPIEVIGILTKPFALMIRLFANITAGHIIVISLVGLIFIFKSLAVSPVAVAFALFIDVLEVLVAFLQAYIFTMLTALFIGTAVGDHNEDATHANEDEKHLANAH
jgi:F-type H+-transporting ATPase subunit a